MTEQTGEVNLGIDFDEYDNTPSGWASRWAAEFAYAREFHRKWQTSGKEVVSKYLMRDIKSNDTNAPGYNVGLFWANVKTQMDMMYGQVPKVSVDRRWADPDDQLARVACEMAERLLNADIEEAGEDFSTVLRSCLQDRLLPGLGCVRVRYDLEEGEPDKDSQAATDGKQGEEDEADDTEELETEENPQKAKLDEWLEDIYVPWTDVLWSPARFYKEIRWIAFRTYKNKSELKAFIGKGTSDFRVQDIPFNSKNPMEQLSAKSSQIWNKAEVWEIWSKEFGYVFWWIDGFPKILKSEKDPLELEGFFPCPPFLISNTTTMEYVPKADYTFAEAQYKEIDILSERIALLTKAVKVVGVYDKKAGPDIGRMVNETAENKLIPVDAWAVFQERGGIKGSVEFLPIDQIVTCLGQLQEQKQSRVAELYQITGMSDILRGAAEDKAQVGTQQLKAKFASIRVQAVQDDFTRFATDHQRLRLEIICKFFEPEQMIRRSNMMETPDNDPVLLMQACQFLKDSEISKWRIMIQPESMAMMDYSQIRQERTEYINSLGIFLQSSFPIAEKFPEAAPVLMELLKWGLAGFKGSKQIEGVIDRAMSTMAKAAAAGQGQQQQNPEAIKAQAEQQRMQQEMQHSQQEHQAKMQEQQQKSSLEMTGMKMEFQAKIAELQAEQKARDQKHASEQQDREHKMRTSILESLMTNGPQLPANQPQPPLGMGAAPPAQPQVNGNGIATT